MKVIINKSKAIGKISAPPSKSMAHRMLISAGLSEGKSIVHKIAPSEDILATLDCLEALGAKYNYDGYTVEIEGIGRGMIFAKNTMKCRESGSTLRFFLPLCMIYGKETVFDGSETLLNRPLGVYEDLCKNNGILFKNNGKEITVKGTLNAGVFEIPGNISSQFITGLLFALPLLTGDSLIKIIPPIESLSYINLTIDALAEFGIIIKWKDENTLYIKGNQKYQPREVTVEGDYSNTAFFEALNTVGSDVKIEGLNPKSIQGDRVYKELFKKLDNENPTIDISDCPDLGPILFAIAGAKHGGTFTGTKRLKIKESDRSWAMASELLKFGIETKIGEDTVKIYPKDFHKPTEVLYGHNDHRIVMSLSVLLTLTGGTIDGAEAVRKSMPDFFKNLENLGVDIQYENI